MKRYNDGIQIGQLDMFYLYFNINLNSQIGNVYYYLQKSRETYIIVNIKQWSV